MQTNRHRRQKGARAYYKADPSSSTEDEQGRVHSAGPGRLSRAGAGTDEPPAESTSSTKSPVATYTKPARSRRQLQLSILIGALVLVLILCLVLAALLPGCRQTAASSSAFVSSSSTSEDYDKDAMSIPVSQYAGTILEETEKADSDYVEETLFLGDSNTAGMLLHSSVTGVTMANGIGIESMGITSVTTLRCVRFSGLADMTMPKAVAIMQPRRVVITFGTNNAGMSVESFITSYKAATDAIKEAYPAADIIIGSVFPITKACRYGSLSQKQLDEFNLALVEFAQEEEFKFLNWAEALKDPQSGYCRPEYMQGDGVHLNEKGQTAIFEYFNTHSYITEDNRPKPLQSIPRRLPTPEGLFPKPESSSSNPPPSSSSLPPSSVSIPSGYTLTVAVSDNVGGAGITGGNASLQVTEGQTVSVAVSAHASVVIDGVTYNFAGWSNGDANPSTTIAFAAPPATAPVYYIVATYVAAAPPVVEPPPASEPPAVDPPPTDPPPAEQPPADPVVPAGEGAPVEGG